MVDKKLVDYIKSELSKGIPINYIKQKLLSKGWSNYNITQAINLATQNTSSMMSTPAFHKELPPKSNKVWIFSILLVIVIIGGIFAFFILNEKKSDEVVANGGNKSGIIANQTKFVNCGTDIDCFINKTYRCNLSNLTYDFNVNILGWVQNHSYYYEIKRGQPDNCTLYIEIKNVSGSYDDATVQAFLDNNMTQSEIDQQEQEFNNALQATIGLDEVCIFEQKKLTEIFTDLKSGNISSTDWTGCSGEMFAS